jgi:3-hydroxy-9,10-secoandrosta-1,3,5(10)-triene-9,17-dione monooxygenase
VTSIVDPHTDADAIAQSLIAAADAMRPHLLAEQAATEQRSCYSPETHAMFDEAGFYRMFVPRRYGGLEVDYPTFYQVVMSIARGCPSTGWMMTLSIAHSLQLASYWPEQAQDELLNGRTFLAPASFSFENATAVPVDGGYQVSGTWHFCSGVPYSTHHMGLVPVEGSSDSLVVIVPRESYRVLDNWGDLIGLKGSGSNSVVVDGAFVPSHHAIKVEEWMSIGVSTTRGYELHGNPLYGGSFMAIALGELTSIQVGNAQAAVDEYEYLLTRPTRKVAGKPGPERARDPHHQRILGLALAYTDAARSIVERCSQLVSEYAREAMTGGRTFDNERTFRLYGQWMTAHKLCWEAGDMVFRAGSSSGARDGARLQRMWRDLCAFRTNGVHQLDFQAPSIAQAHLGFPISFFDE